METQLLSVTDMTCPGCAESLTHALHEIRGVKHADVSIASRSATIQFDERKITIDELEQVIQRAGFDVSQNGATESPQHSEKGRCCG